MPGKDILDVWKSTVSARPHSKDTFKRMHLSVLRQAIQQKTDEQLYIIQFDIQDFVLCEWKGRLTSLVGFELPKNDEHILWLGFQFHGSTRFLSSGSLEQDSMRPFIAQGSDDHFLTLSAERQWALYIGVKGASKQKLLSELPYLREQFEKKENKVLPAVPLTQANRKVIDTLSKKPFGPFTTLHQLGKFIFDVYNDYAHQLTIYFERQKEEPNIYLYHQAIAYIRANYIKQALSHKHIATALNCSGRTLTRAFEGRGSSLSGSILNLRLYKSRELLRKQLELSVEQIAFLLFFPDAKHFAVQYKKEFHKTPREERTIAVKNAKNRIALQQKSNQRK